MKTIITGQFKHETNRYCVGVSGVKEFTEREYLFGEESIRGFFKGAQNEIMGFCETFDPVEDCRLVPVMSVNASPGPVVEQAIWDRVAAELLAAIDAQEQVDGILLALHGAMVTENYEDGEGELLELLRRRVGPDVPIITSLDLHVNMTQKMIDNATALFPYDYYPHTDLYEAGLRAADCMKKTLWEGMKPTMAWRKLDMIFPYVPTAHPPFVPLLEKAQALREAPGFVNVNICHGFFASDIYEQGAAVIAVTDGNMELAQKAADQLGEQVYAVREQLIREFYTPEAAVKEAMESDSFPVVLADVSDNPGSGGSTDATAVLKALIAADAQGVAMAVMYDPEVVLQAEKAGTGSTIHVELGGKIVPQITGGPVVCDAYVKALTDGTYRNRDKMAQGLPVRFGKCAVLVIGGIQVIVCSSHTQPWDLEVYRHAGIQPQDMKILVVKSAAHFRASFGKVAAKILDVDAPALGPMDVTSLPLAHSRRPIWPLDR